MREALDARYREAMDRANARGAMAEARELESLAKGSSAVVAMPLSFFKEFVASETALYSTYQLQVRASVRQASSPDDDRMRLAVDATVHGSYGERISYAALSVDGRGLASYGNVFVRLRDVAVSARATVLERNSWDFIRDNQLFGKPMPPGHLAMWGERHKLVCAKLADFLNPGMTPTQIRSLILRTSGSRTDDEFLEVHIFGTFNADSIESVQGNVEPKKAFDIAMLAFVKEKLAKLGKNWVDS